METIHKQGRSNGKAGKSKKNLETQGQAMEYNQKARTNNNMKQKQSKQERRDKTMEKRSKKHLENKISKRLNAKQRKLARPTSGVFSQTL